MFEAGTVVSVGDAALFVSVAGKADGAPLVLLHGGLGSRMDFAALGQGLASEVRLIAIDSRGHGRSYLGHAAMTYRQLAEDVSAVLHHMGLERAAILGHSDGGIVALRLAAWGLLRPQFMVVAGAHWRLDQDDPVRDIYRDITAQAWREMFAPHVERYEQENPKPDFPRLFAAAQGMWLGNDTDAYPGDAVSAIAAPLLVIHGDDDFLVSRRQAFELTERVPNGRLLNLPVASHTVLQDQPGDVLPALASFMASVREEAPRAK